MSSNDLAVDNGFEAHDIGAGLMFTGLDKRLALMGSVMNGALSPNNLDLNNGKSYYGRATFAITPMLSVGGSYASHDFVQRPDTTVPADSSATNTGWGLDAQWSAPGNEGLYVMVDYLSGESTLNSANEIWGFQGVAAYNIRMQSPTSFLYAIEPAFRYDIAEPNNSIVERPDDPDHRRRQPLPQQQGAVPPHVRVPELRGLLAQDDQRLPHRADHEFLRE